MVVSLILLVKCFYLVTNSITWASFLSKSGLHEAQGSIKTWQNFATECQHVLNPSKLVPSSWTRKP